jgi:hypothetical protein
MNRGPWRQRGVQPSPNSPFQESGPGIWRTTFGPTKEGDLSGISQVSPVSTATSIKSWDSRRPSARRPSGIPFHTYPLLSAGRRGGARGAERDRSDRPCRTEMLPVDHVSPHLTRRPKRRYLGIRRKARNGSRVKSPNRRAAIQGPAHTCSTERNVPTDPSTARAVQGRVPLREGLSTSAGVTRARRPSTGRRCCRDVWHPGQLRRCRWYSSCSTGGSPPRR